jgi:hypothetical protein
MEYSYSFVGGVGVGEPTRSQLEYPKSFPVSCHTQSETALSNRPRVITHSSSVEKYEFRKSGLFYEKLFTFNYYKTYDFQFLPFVI